jgi:glycosyltransferase involved in cell wall biosynthesis
MPETLVIVAARDEADRLAATIEGLRDAFGEAEVWVADDASTDGTAEIALAHGARVVSRGRPHGKGGNMTAAAEAALSGDGDASIVVVCDGDLGESAAQLRVLAAPIADGDADLAVGAFRHRLGGGFGVALRFARWAIRSRCGYDAVAPISGQRAMRTEVLRATLPFADGFGMEVGMTIDAARAGYRITEVELDLAHRATGKTAAGFLHRARQLRDFARAWWARRPGPTSTS